MENNEEKHELPPITLPAIRPDPKLGRDGVEGAKHVHARMEQFLTAYQKRGKIGAACRSVNVSYETHRKWLEMYPQYKRAFDRIRQLMADELEGAVYERALNGVEKQTIKDGMIASNTEYDVGREALMLKGLKPEVYSNSIDVRLKNESDQELRDGIYRLLAKAGIQWDGNVNSLDLNPAMVEDSSVETPSLADSPSEGTSVPDPTGVEGTHDVSSDSSSSGSQ